MKPQRRKARLPRGMLSRPNESAEEARSRSERQAIRYYRKASALEENLQKMENSLLTIDEHLADEAEPSDAVRAAQEEVSYARGLLMGTRELEDAIRQDLQARPRPPGRPDDEGRLC